MAVLYIHGPSEASEGREIPTEVISDILNWMDLGNDRCSERKTS